MKNHEERALLHRMSSKNDGALSFPPPGSAPSGIVHSFFPCCWHCPWPEVGLRKGSPSHQSSPSWNSSLHLFVGSWQPTNSLQIFWFASFEVGRGVIGGGSTEKTRGNTFQRLARKTHQLCYISHGPWLPAAGVESQDLFCTGGNREPERWPGGPQVAQWWEARKGKEQQGPKGRPGPGLWKWKN